MSAAEEERFWSKVAKSEGDGCWEWIAGRDGKNYGAFWIGKDIRAHRFAWMLEFGPIPEDMFICHHCDNPPCVRPDHLFLGSALDNAKDCVRKGRKPLGGASSMGLHPGIMAGSQNPHARFDEEDIQAIRKAHSDGVLTGALAKKYGVARQTIQKVVTRKSWCHVAALAPREEEPR